MITKLNVASIYVLDKDEALDFYVNKLGLEKGNDVRQGDYRWLTVRVPGEPGTEISLEQPGPPLHDEATAAQIRELITKGAIGGLVFITDDARGLYETLKARGVTDFTQEPTDHFYGTDMGIRDPFGNPHPDPSAGKGRPGGDGLNMAERNTPMTQSKQSAKRRANVWTDEERAAMQESARERKAASRRGKGDEREDGERDIREKIAAMPETERAMAERLHAIVTRQCAGPRAEDLLRHAGLLQGREDDLLLPAALEVQGAVLDASGSSPRPPSTMATCGRTPMR